jgi:CheY-like chemotaxis protein
MSSPKASLLVVEDDPAFRRTLLILLSALGYTVRTVANGPSALDAIGDEVPDLMLSELDTPGMSRFELLLVVRHRYPSVRVIAMSDAFPGTAVPPGVAADAFYYKGKRSPLLLRIVETMMRPPRSPVVHPPVCFGPSQFPPAISTRRETPMQTEIRPPRNESRLAPMRPPAELQG